MTILLSAAAGISIRLCHLQKVCQLRTRPATNTTTASRPSSTFGDSAGAVLRCSWARRFHTQSSKSQSVGQPAPLNSVRLVLRVVKSVSQSSLTLQLAVVAADLTSVASTLDVLFNLSTPLSRRTMWSGRFDELLLPYPRPEAEMPLHLPDAPVPAEPWSCKTPHSESSSRRTLQHRQQHEELVDSSLNQPQHCGATEQTCRARDLLSTKQERLMSTLSELSGEPLPPDAKAMAPNVAGKWLARAWETWRSNGHQPK